MVPAYRSQLPFLKPVPQLHAFCRRASRHCLLPLQREDKGELGFCCLCFELPCSATAQECPSLCVRSQAGGHTHCVNSGRDSAIPWEREGELVPREKGSKDRGGLFPGVSKPTDKYSQLRVSRCHLRRLPVLSKSGKGDGLPGTWPC